MVESHWVPLVYFKNFSIFPKSANKRSRNKKVYFFNKNRVLKEGIDNIDIQRFSLDEICISKKFYSENMEKYLNIKVETNILNDTFTKIITEKSVKTLDNN